ncbi:MAG: hypothetical protein JNL84_10025 [Candidatus Accumulibacter sp.]|nr:hypothetical protein [Accumulibacter sp.]
MRTEDRVTTIKEAFGQHPEDVLAPARVAAEGFGWLNEILVSIQREAEGGNCALRIVKLAADGALHRRRPGGLLRERAGRHVAEAAGGRGTSARSKIACLRPEPDPAKRLGFFVRPWFQARFQSMVNAATIAAARPGER